MTISLHNSTADAPVSILIPSYNEENGILPVLADIRENFIKKNARREEDIEIIVVDDGSTDATAQRAASAGVRVIRHTGNLGYGASLKTGLRAARHEIIVITDADGTYPSESIQSLVSELEQCDMAVGMRTGKEVHIPLERRPAKAFLRWFAVFLVKKPIPDLNSGLRAFRKADAMRFLSLYPSGFSFTTTITLAYLSSDLLVRYLPINYRQRVGKSKLRPIRDTKNLIFTVLRSILFFNPLRVCLPVATLLFAVALYVLLFIRDVHGNVLDSTVAVFIMSGIMVVVVGFLADIIARIR